MAEYKVPQDVEADDKLIGPFSFRQFVYLLVAAGLIALAVGLFQIFPLLAIIPLPPVLLFLVLALPIKKDQPMETYLAALVTYYLKPHTRIWVPGQRESTIKITAPKIVEDVRTRDLSQEEATRRLSFLADIVDTEGRSITGTMNSSVQEDLVAEAKTVDDIFDNYKTVNLDRAINKNKEELHEEVIREMRETIDRNNKMSIDNTSIRSDHGLVRPSGSSEPPAHTADVNVESTGPVGQQIVQPRTMVQPMSMAQPAKMTGPVVQPQQVALPNLQKNTTTVVQKPSIMELANNPDFTIATIAKEANRINRKEEGEVFISLH